MKTQFSEATLKRMLRNARYVATRKMHIIERSSDPLTKSLIKSNKLTHRGFVCKELTERGVPLETINRLFKEKA